MSSKYRIIPLGGGGGGITPSGTLDIRSEGVFDVSRYAAVDVDIFDDTTTKRITNNGTYNASADHVLGYSQVTVDVQAQPVLQNKTVSPTTAQQTVQHDQGYDGLGTVTVDAVTSAIDNNISPSNIRDGVTILGVTGTYTGGSMIDPHDFFHFTNYQNNTKYINLGPYRDGTGAELYYSNDPTVPLDQWTRWEFHGGQNDNITVGPGESVYLYGNNPVGIPPGMDGSAKFVTNDVIAAEGNIMSLLSVENKTYAPGNAFYELFAGCHITSPPELPATTVGQNAYYRMFSYCTDLMSLPSLPATTLYNQCYYGMFQGCSSISSIPSGYLPATVLAVGCYASMFSYCNLIYIPSDLLPATTLAEGCYEAMFESCVMITSTPNLPALEAPNYCYQNMFNGCSSIATLGSISATTAGAGAFAYMFSDCTSITEANYILPSTFLPGANSTFANMFYLCTSLRRVNQNMLPATTLKDSCYAAMFADCSALEKAPKLPATTLAYGCYTEMFSGCTSLNEIELYFSDTGDQQWYDQDQNWYPFSERWTYGVAQSGTFKKMGNANIPTNDPNSDMYNGIPENWTVQTIDYFYIQNEAAGPNVFTLNTPNPNYLSTDLAYSIDGSTWTQFQKGSGITTQTVNMSQGDKLYLRSSTGFATVQGMGSFSPITITCSDLFSAHGDLRTLIDYTNPSGVTSIPQGSFYRMFYGTGYLTEVDCTLNGVTSLPSAAFSEFAADTSSRSTPLTRARILMPDVTSVYGISLAAQAGSFYRAFQYRNNLSEITLPNLQGWNENGFKNWLAYVSATGTAYAPAGVSIPTGPNGIPTNWTRVNY